MDALSSAARTTSARSSAIYHRLARRLYPYRVVIGVLGGSAIAAFFAVALALGGTVDALYALASLTVLLWVFWLLSVTFIFVDPKPALEPVAPFRRRVMIRVRRGFLILLALLTTALLIVAIAMTFRTLSLFVAT